MGTPRLSESRDTHRVMRLRRREWRWHVGEQVSVYPNVIKSHVRKFKNSARKCSCSAATMLTNRLQIHVWCLVVTKLMRFSTNSRVIFKFVWADSWFVKSHSEQTVLATAYIRAQFLTIKTTSYDVSLQLTFWYCSTTVYVYSRHHVIRVSFVTLMQVNCTNVINVVGQCLN